MTINTPIRLGQLLLLVLLFLTGISVQAAPTDKPPFYRLQINGSTTYLLGSIHVGKADMYPMASVIERKLEDADGIVLEVLLEQANMVDLVQRYGMGAQDIDRELLNKRQAFCKNYATQCASIPYLKAWMQASVITMIRFGEQGLTPEYGVETWVSANYPEHKRYQLESTEFQFQLFSGLSNELQQLMLQDALEADEQELSALVEVWRSGNEADFLELIEDGFSNNRELMDAVLTERNYGMAAELSRLLDSNKQQKLVVIVGAAHLVGPESLPDIFKKRGAIVSSCWKVDC
ncbi:TraB/GumN family protein [Paraferrimonas haliotis]|uniref:Protein GumN n=1 Tax=Paraferrimonas haliotis TaxID=2013866 RepID=A0AA37TQG9_9GAMM|nr:TraB/GumN family protein [Paraferrimonas haliotis]GLS82407.1 protein GumN [Paraferrimonas haliotis]